MNSITILIKDAIRDIKKVFQGKGQGQRKGDKDKDGDEELEDDEDEEEEPVAQLASEFLKSIFQMFTFASQQDICLLIVGTIFTIIHGACFPVLALLFGNISETLITQSFTFPTNSSNSTHQTSHNRTHSSRISRDSSELIGTLNSTAGPLPRSGNATNQHQQGQEMDSPFTMIANLFGYLGQHFGLSSDSGPLSEEELVDYIVLVSWYFLCIALVVLISSYIQTVCWEMAAENQVFKIRNEFLSNILRQELTYFETSTAGYLIAKLADDAERIREGIGHKFSVIIEYVSCFVIGSFFALCVNWKLTFISGLSVPFILGKMINFVRTDKDRTIERQEQYGKVSALSEEVLEDVRTVCAFGTEEKESQLYKKKLNESYKTALNANVLGGFSTAVMYMIVFSAFAGAAFLASSQLFNHMTTPRQVYTVIACVSIAIIALSSILPFLRDVGCSQGCLTSVLKVINREPKIDAFSNKGRRPHRFTGEITLAHVAFSYATRKDTAVLRDVNLVLKPGSTVAIFSSGGEGKSTLADILLRLYIPSGVIKFDGFPIENLNLKWIRDQIGLVSNKSVFQANTVHNNITGERDDITNSEVLETAKLTCAHNFILKLPGQYQSMIGLTDRELCFHEEQKLAIARVLIKNPKILILDEAYSELDMSTIAKLLTNLRSTSAHRTTIIMSHTVADICMIEIIHVLKDGKIIESGSHNELMTQKGFYYEMAMKEKIGEVPLMDDTDIPSVNENEFEGVGLVAAPEVQDDGAVASAEEISELEENTDDLLKYPKASEFVDQIIRTPGSYGYIFLAVVGCLLCGLSPSAFALVSSQLFIAFSESGTKLTDDAEFWAKMVFVVGGGTALGYWMMIVGICAIGENLTFLLRHEGYSTILKQQITWFDEDEHISERLYNIFSRNAPVFKVAIGSRLGVVLCAIISILTAIIVTFVLKLELALPILAGLPVLCLVIFISARMYKRKEVIMDLMLEGAFSIATESVQDVRTIQTLSKQDSMLENFSEVTHSVLNLAKRESIYVGIPFAISETINFVIYAAVFRLGAHLIDIGEMQPRTLFEVFMVLVFASFSLARVTCFLPDYISAGIAYAKLDNVADLHSKIDGCADTGDISEIKGKITFDNVTFSYDQPDSNALEGISFNLGTGKCLAVVGGDGKSTLISLVLRFYDCSSGQVKIDDKEITSFQVEHLRSAIGYVPQDPTLFNRTVRKNILYGYDGGLRGPKLQKLIERVVETVRIKDFIASLPKGYKTKVGVHGASLTGAERQRIALARALIRNPKILLLDEPTCYQDPAMEELLIPAIKKEISNRTCILSSKSPRLIKLADYVIVLDKLNGKIIESGTHRELKAKNGVYFKLMYTK